MATHPEAAKTYPATPQPASSVLRLSHRGQEIKTLRAFKNRLYIGYGQDDGPNIPGSCKPHYISPAGAHWCPIIVRYFDTASGRLSGVVDEFNTQELSTLEVLNGSLYGLAEDLEGAHDYFKCSASRCVGGNTHSRVAHLYSATELNGVIYMSGSSGLDGVIWKSSNNGNSWTETKRVKPAAAVVNRNTNFSRFYDVGGPYKGKLYAHARDWYTGFQIHTLTYDGNSRNHWAPQNFSLERINPTRRMRAFAGQLVFIEAGNFKQFDGTSVQHTYAPHTEDFTIVGKWLYVLNSASGQHNVMKTRDLKSWFYVDKAPSTAISLEVVGNKVYVGTKNARIYKSDVDEIKTSSHIPISQILFLLLNE